MNKRPTFSIQEKSSFVDSAVLIVGTVGTIGEALYQKLAKDTTIVKSPIIPDALYSYIIAVDNGDIAKEGFLTKLLRKAQKDNASFIFVSCLLNVNKKIITNILNSYKKVKVIIYGDIAIADNLIARAQRTKRIEVNGDGLGKTYPVFLDDVISGILQVTFGVESKDSIFYLFPKHPITELSLSHMIQKADPTIGIDFTRNKKKSHEEPSPPEDGKYILPENYSLERRIRQKIMFGDKTKLGKIQDDIINFKERKRNLLPFVSLFIFLVVFLPFIFTLLFSVLGLTMLKNAVNAIDNGNIKKAHVHANLAKTFFTTADKMSNLVLFKTDSFTKEINKGREFTLITLYFLDAQGNLASVFKGESKKPREDFTKAKTALKNALVLFEDLKAKETLPKNLNSKINSIDPLIKLVGNTLDIMPRLLGFDEKKVYLILFQNNMELRPGGGFIGSYGILTLYKGKIINLSIHDVYEADGQLRGHVEPPFAIRRYLASPHWYLRDSNFDVDFVKAAYKASFFLNLETGEGVDGVIGIDVSFAKKILEAIGTVYVRDFKEKVSYNNLFEITQKHVEKDFFPGSTQKKDFLRSLFKSMQLKLGASNNLPYFSLARAVSDSIVEKHLLFVFSDPSLQKLFTINDWSSALWEQRQERKDSVNDFLAISEANIGVNKVNYFARRKVAYKAIMDEDGKIQGSVKISYKNTSNPEISWAGDYKNYLRIILPKDSVLSSIAIDNSPTVIVPAITDPLIYEAKNFIPQNALEVEETQEEGKKVYGFLVTVPPGALKTITVNYDLGPKGNLNLPLVNYDFYYFKQPGTDAYPFEFSFSFPKSRRVIGSKVYFSGNIFSDKKIIISLAKTD